MEVGIDFGTTKALAAWEERGEVKVCEPIPSVVWFEEESRKPPHVGHAPPEDSFTWVGQPGVKRQFGESGKRRWFPQEVAAHVLGELRARLPSPPAGEPLSAVLTAPASWGMRQRAILRESAELAGFQVRRILPEPEALAFWWSRQPGRATDRALLTVNFGGGTIDVAVVETDTSVVETVAIGGAPIGGFDFDSLVLEYAAQTAKVDPQTLRGARLRRFMAALENAKKATLAGQNGQLRLWRGEGQEAVVVELRGEEIQKRSQPLLTAARKVVSDTRAQAGARPLAWCLLIGGSARIQSFRSQLVSELNGTRLHECQGDEIARGALLHARALSSLDGLLLSALPRPVGILIEQDKPSWVLKQGLALPCRASSQFTAKGSLPALPIHVVEGGAQPGTHELLGTVSLELPQKTGSQAPTSAEQPEELPFEVTIDLNGNFEIVAEVRAAGQTRREVVTSPARLNPAQKSVMGSRIDNWVKARRAARPHEAHQERLQALAREATELASELEKRRVEETARRLRGVAEAIAQLLAAGSASEQVEPQGWEALRARAQLLRAISSIEGDWPLPTAPPGVDAASLSDTLLAAAQGMDRQWLAEVEAELSSARKAGTLRATVDGLLQELPSGGRGRHVLTVLAAPVLTASQLGQALPGVDTPWQRYAASCVALTSEEPETACGALGLLLDWADRSRGDHEPLGLIRPPGKAPAALGPLRALYPEGFVFPFTWLLWAALRPGTGREWLPTALGARAATPLLRGVLALATGRPEAAPDNAPNRLRLACDLALVLSPKAPEGALERLARWREEEPEALARAVAVLDGETRALLVFRASAPGAEALLAWLLAGFSAADGGLGPLLRPVLDRMPEERTLWRVIAGIASRELEQLALEVLLLSPRSAAAMEGAAGYLSSLSGKVSARKARFYELVSRVRRGGKLGAAGLLRAVWTWLIAPELRAAAARLIRGTEGKVP
jgi:molecular chaperone DnaK (HSP70)